jgi:hypothetical protein
MTFSVQKADGTCVGANCSTYLADWADGGGSSVNWAANLSPSLNSQMKAGQHWTMTIQNAGLGYNGYLSSPSGKRLPAGGAQFKLMTQNEINDQPPWAVALEKIGGEAIAIVGITIATAGVADALFGAEEVDLLVDAPYGGPRRLSVIYEEDSYFEEDNTVRTIEESFSVDSGSSRSEDLNDFERGLMRQATTLFVPGEDNLYRGRRLVDSLIASFNDENF